MEPTRDDGSSSEENDKESKRGITLMTKVVRSKNVGIKLHVINYNPLFVLLLFQHILTISF